MRLLDIYDSFPSFCHDKRVFKKSTCGAKNNEVRSMVSASQLDTVYHVFRSCFAIKVISFGNIKSLKDGKFHKLLKL